VLGRLYRDRKERDFVVDGGGFWERDEKRKNPLPNEEASGGNDGVKPIP